MDAIENGNYVYDNGWYKSAFRVYIPYGRGLGLTTEQVMAIRQVVQLDGCSIRFTYKSKNIPHDTLVGYVNKSDKKGQAGDNLDEAGDTSVYRDAIKFGYKLHWAEYGNTKSEPNSTAIQHIMYLFCKAKTLDKLKEQIDTIKNVYKKGEHKDFTQYIELVPLLGKEYKTMKEVFTSNMYLLDKDTDTNLQTHYSGIDNFESGVLQDENGTPIGVDVYSAVAKQSGVSRKSKILFDFNSYTNTKALVAIPKDMSLEHYYYTNKMENNIVPTASVLGQAIANHIILNAHVAPINRRNKGLSNTHNHKVAHIVLNGFDYKNVANTNIYLENPRLFNVIDMNNAKINPLQPTGDYSEQDKLYSSLSKKISTLLNAGYNYKLQDSAIVAIETAVNGVFTGTRWGEHDEDKKILNQDPLIFPDISQVIEKLSQKRAEYLEDKLSSKAEDMDTLIDIASKIVFERKNIIAEKTRFTIPFSYQTYFDFSTIPTESLKIIQLINSINTIVSSLSDGDCLIIHGADRIPPKVFTDYLNYEVNERILDKGARIVYCMDSFITGSWNKVTDYKGVLYENYDKDFDYLIQGYVPENEFSKITSLYGENFNSKVKMDWTYDSVQARTLLRRSSTLKTALCDIDGGII